MPFITQSRREQLAEAYDDSILPISPGDRCYLFYKQMVRRWKENPRWTTAHEIFKDMLDDDLGKLDVEDFVASRLAWQCFFYFHVLPYEIQKREENGDV